MESLFKINLNGVIRKIKNLWITIKKIPWILGENAFLFILIFILLDILFGELIFYKYIFLVRKEEPKVASLSTKFQENIYQSVFKEVEKRENILNNPSSEIYIDLFK
ncbi:MAG: hypothetical protein A3C58_03795 [Candidatus Staskawiczbacteria bacterium RIFCSPHIGHO2_02_FULL_34_10]|uniref:Uncharacterized protein n=1 Tax=Candidatus Staskawiczbacteria bacterium RIFCSPHIGHO2_02_FULL_34_10 TaxID=1802205 RepID=A0A1G2HY17_9BACT|nr:MAG: hypothetical protein A3C58_03795 [Candidatus Staskawiczbacteria bacterium RIFCSPHIGHO2_02_FULL_34_10]